MKDTNYYNSESEIYSQKRYPGKTGDYIHYFFKKRLAIVIDMIGKIIVLGDRFNLLEVGCADGVVIKKIEERFGNKFSEMQGIDLSPLMIEAAKKNSAENSKIRYKVRNNDYKVVANFDIIIEVGVINYTDFLAELKFAQKNLRKGGCYILSVAGKDALMVKLGKAKKEAFNSLLNYADYEKKIVEYFNIIKVVPCGFWLPGLWKLPILARIVQPCLDFLLLYPLPNFFHEKVYLLKTKEQPKARN